MFVRPPSFRNVYPVTATGSGKSMRYRAMSIRCTPRSTSGPPPEIDRSENQPPGSPACRRKTAFA
ncbi:hypothetical protein CMsap09_00200 [Clavibacter michiganensis]|uniref:Uncharacterized protein n=1 Tax=Clavibacter michiganensis TaxID=28447 RepID=A0A251XP38_9MICO|nr:hypothetical protein CMsap09_00200 [Clavibacter michiganensis]